MVIHLQCVQHLGNLANVLPFEVVVPACLGGVQIIRQRHDVHQDLGVRVKSIRWNDIAWKGFPSRRIRDYPQSTTLVEGLREISQSLSRCGNRDVGDSLRQVHSPILLGVEEKQLLFLGVEFPRNIDWTTTAKTKGPKSIDGLRNPIAIVEEIVGI